MRNLYILLALSTGLLTLTNPVSINDFGPANEENEIGIHRSYSSNDFDRTLACNPVSTFTEDFTAAAPPNLPTCWEKISNGGFVSTQSAGANSSPNALFMASPGNNNPNIAVVAMPSISNLIAGTHRLRFSIRAESNLGGVIEVGTVANSMNPATFTLIQRVTASSFTYQSHIITPGVVNGREALAFRHTGSPTFGVLIDDVVWEPIPLCVPPTGITASSVTGNSASVSWTASTSNPANYDIYLNTTGTAPTTATIPTAAGISSPYTAGNLTASTTYYVWVRSNCGTNGASGWSAMQSFTTACNAASLPYFLNFDGVTAPALPACITRENANNDNRFWQTVPAPPGYTGNVMSYLFSPNNAANDWFFTQGLSLVAGKSYVLSYKFGNNAPTFSERLKIAFGTAASGAGMTTLIADYPAINDNTPRVHKIRFAAPATGVYFIGFQAYSEANKWELYVDEISVTEANVAPTTVNTCVPVFAPRIDLQNNTKWMALVDGSGNIVGEMNANGNNLGNVTAKVFRNSGPLRRDGANRYYLDRNIEITPTTQPTTAVSIRLYFTAAELGTLAAQQGSNVSSFANISAFKSNDGCGSKVTNGAFKISTFTLPFGTDYAATFDVNSFSTFFFAASSFSALPATIISFSGARQGNVNQLNWVVAQEGEVLEYEVERSENNGAAWTKVGTVLSLGNTVTQRSYSFNDRTISGLKQLYRLRQVDRSGVAKLSSIVNITSAKPAKLSLSGLYPNPAASRLNLMVDAPQRNNLKVEILDAIGRVVKSQNNAVETGSNAIQVNVNNLKQGTYFIRILCSINCETILTRFVKE